MDVVDAVYDYANTLPDNEKYGLRSQSTRCAVSILSNIAEGSGKTSDRDFARFTEISLGSAYELETQLFICQRRKFGDQQLLEKALSLLHEEQRMITSFHNRLRSNIGKNLKSLVAYLLPFV